MKYVVPALFTLILVTPAVSAQTSWAENLFPEGITHDFGSIPHGTQLYHRFKLANKYAVPLEISYRIGCTCVTVTPSARVLQPTEEGYLDVNMDALRFKGPKSVNIYFSVGPKYISSTTLQVTANSRADVVLNPGQISFGVVPSGQLSAARTIDVEYAGVLDWRVTEIVKHDAPLQATFRELYRRPGQVGYRVTVSLKPDAPANTLKHELLLKTNDPASPLVPVLVEATVQASLTAVPSSLSMGNLKVGESVSKKVIVRGSKPFRVVSVEGTGEGLTAEFGSGEAPVQVVLVKCDPAKAGELKRQLGIKTNLDQESVVIVRVEGTIGP
jgi:hypothetical protein